MKRYAFLLLAVAVAATGCLNMQPVEPAPPPPAPVEPPPPPPVLPGQVTETNAQQVIQALNEELDRAATEKAATPAPAPAPASAPTPRP